MMKTWEKPPYYLAAKTEGDRTTVWASAQPITADSPGEDKYCLLVAEVPAGATPERVADGLIETLVVRRSQRCDVI
jgi:hypothetical protein